LVSGTGVDQHVPPAQGRDRPARVVVVAARLTTGTIRRNAAIAAQVEAAGSGTRRRPTLGIAPIIGDVRVAIVDPGAWRKIHRRPFHDAVCRTLQPVVEPFEIGIARPKIAGVDKRVLVGADPQPLGAGAGLNVIERRQDARLEDVVPGGDVKPRNIDRAAEIVPRTERVRSRMGDDLVEKGLPGSEIRVSAQWQPNPPSRCRAGPLGARHRAAGSAPLPKQPSHRVPPR